MLLFIWLNIHELCFGSCVLGAVCMEGVVWGDCMGELCGGSCVGGLCGGAVWRELCGWDCVRSCVGLLCGELWGGEELRGELLGELCVGHAHQSPDGPGIQTPSPPVLPAQGNSPPPHQLPPVQPLPRCPHPQQQPCSPLQSVTTSLTACSSACAPSSSLSR